MEKHQSEAQVPLLKSSQRCSASHFMHVRLVAEGCRWNTSGFLWSEFSWRKTVWLLTFGFLSWLLFLTALSSSDHIMKVHSNLPKCHSSLFLQDTACYDRSGFLSRLAGIKSSREGEPFFKKKKALTINCSEFIPACWILNQSNSSF